MSRFDYVKYDAQSIEIQEKLKMAFELIEKLSETIYEGRAKKLFLTHLEIAYMWTGKAIRDQQIARNVNVAHAPERG